MDDDILETPETSEEGFAPLDPEPAPAPEPEPAPPSGPEGPAAPVEVITVEDLLDRLTGGTGEGGEAEEPPQEAEGDAGTEVPAVSEDPIEVVGMDTALKRLETIQGVVGHPMMETPFEDYTVMEGLLLLIFVILLLDFFLDLLRRWF